MRAVGSVAAATWRNFPRTGDAGYGAQAAPRTRVACVRCATGSPKGYEVGYDVFTINGRMLGHGGPLRVRAGGRVLFHFLNGSTTEIRSLALPRHTLRIVTPTQQ